MLTLLLTTLFTFVELNCENLFDCSHDEGFNDYEYLPTSVRKWDKSRYWEKVGNVARALIACGGDGAEWTLPDMLALTEVENDSVMVDLLHRSPLRSAGYEYVMTHSNDERGIDVALVWSPFSFRLLSHYPLHVEPEAGHHATRDILYVSGLTAGADTLHVLVVHAPSRASGARATRDYRLRVAGRLCQAIDSIRSTGGSHIVVAGDFNDYANDKALVILGQKGLTNVTQETRGSHGAGGTYKHQGRWRSLDHVLLSPPLADRVTQACVLDAPFLLEEDEKYGGVQPRRTFIGRRYHKGYSDHLPLVVRFEI